MAYSVNTLLSDLSSVVHGTTTNKVPNVYGIINRAARTLLLDVDPKETQRIVLLPQVFNSVFDYSIPVDVKGDSIVDLRPQAGRFPTDIYYQTYAQTFDSQKGLGINKRIDTQWNTGVKSLRIEAPTLTAPVTITDTGSITGWSATTGASSITLDTSNNVAGGGALKFNLNASSSTGSIQNSTLTSLDLSAHLNISTLFLWVYMPSGAAITNVNLKWGSSSSNYWSSTQTQTQQSIAFANGWNLLAFPWVSASSSGSPDATKITYVQVLPTYNSVLQTGFEICNLTSTLGFYFELQYYSKYLFRDPSTNAFQESIADATDNSKIINLDTDSYNLLFNKTAYYVAQSLQGADATYDAEFWGGDDGEGGEYGIALAKYKARNPSESIKKAESYYTLPNKSYNRFQSSGYYRK